MTYTEGKKCDVCTHRTMNLPIGAGWTKVPTKFNGVIEICPWCNERFKRFEELTRTEDRP
jgi:hypothetical protein